jgi:predicted AAA+ superfamily ATPase
MIDSTEIDLIVIDEIQRIPELLNEVHQIIEGPSKKRFLLTGSNPRRLNRKPLLLRISILTIQGIETMTYLLNAL